MVISIRDGLIKNAFFLSIGEMERILPQPPKKPRPDSKPGHPSGGQSLNQLSHHTDQLDNALLQMKKLSGTESGAILVSQRYQTLEEPFGK